MNIVNLTPHDLNLYDENENLVLIVVASGKVARVSVTRVKVGQICDVPIFKSEYGEVENLPAPAPDTIYVVSGMVRAAVPDRTDVYQPGRLLRDENGRVVGAVGLTQ